jgi:hypothetical protein|tara:strand:+ start:338 stop:544 length:207 start_codon:yes stop_codon:yes gene_type:complete
MKKKINNRKTAKKGARKGSRKLEREVDRMGPPVMTTETDIEEVPMLKEGGYCRGAGAAIKGTKFEGVF